MRSSARQAAIIPSYVLRRRDFPDAEGYGAALDALLRRARSIGLIVLAGFMTVLPDQLLPRMWKTASSTYIRRSSRRSAARASTVCACTRRRWPKGVKVTGATVHFVSEVVDGGAIIAQKAVEVEDDDTPETLQKRVMHERGVDASAAGSIRFLRRHDCAWTALSVDAVKTATRSNEGIMSKNVV